MLCTCLALATYAVELQMWKYNIVLELDPPTGYLYRAYPYQYRLIEYPLYTFQQTICPTL
jgi:hypothetical protein